eukprot:SAG11_NODE_512_length_8839_cov_5.600572_12_plen_174_part_00
MNARKIRVPALEMSCFLGLPKAGCALFGPALVRTHPQSPVSSSSASIHEPAAVEKPLLGWTVTPGIPSVEHTGRITKHFLICSQAMMDRQEMPACVVADYDGETRSASIWLLRLTCRHLGLEERPIQTEVGTDARVVLDQNTWKQQSRMTYESDASGRCFGLARKLTFIAMVS